MYLLRVATLVCSSLAFVGCASITSTKLQPVSVTAACDGDDHQGALCTLTNDKGSWFVKTPGTVSINKSYGDLSVECKTEDARGSSVFQSKNEGAVWGNILAGGIIGYAVDANTGAGFSYPPLMAVNMSGKCPKPIKK
jgi:hypothetical protein